MRPSSSTRATISIVSKHLVKLQARCVLCPPYTYVHDTYGASLLARTRGFAWPQVQLSSRSFPSVPGRNHTIGPDWASAAQGKRNISAMNRFSTGISQETILKRRREEINKQRRKRINLSGLALPAPKAVIQAPNTVGTAPGQEILDNNQDNARC